MVDGAAVRGRASLTSAGSATLFAAVSGARHTIHQGMFTCYVGTGAALMSLQETTSGGTSAAVLVGKISASAPMIAPFDFGDVGIKCSATGSRLVLVLESSNSSISLSGVGTTR